MPSGLVASLLGGADVPLDLSAKPLPLVVASIVGVLLVLYLRARRAVSQPPLLNPKKRYELTTTRAREEFARNSRRILEQWFSENPAKPVTINTDMGLMTVLPSKMADEIRNDKRLGFVELTQQTFHSHLPGFEGFREGTQDGEIVRRTVMRELTQNLSKISQPLATEASLALKDLLTDSHEWHTINLRHNILRLVARMSSRVFLGEKLCRSEDWLHVTREYTVTVFKAAMELRKYPYAARYLVHWFLKSCRDARALVKQTRNVIQPVINQRRREAKEAQARGEKPQSYNDAIDWFERETASGQYDAAIVQLVLSLAAIHTTTDLLCQTLGDIVQHPEIIQPLREEAVSILSKEGWHKSSLFKMTLLDSVLKESQRLKPIGMISMRRMALQDLTLSDGTFVPKGHSIGISSHNMWTDESIHSDPHTWNPYRWVAMRDDPSKRHLSHLVTTSPEHLAWGHGAHACPGRFFAAEEAKIAVLSILLKYDLELPEGVVPKRREYGISMSHDPFLNLRVRRREAEIQV
ncbi:cytochrome P450 monooxygenase [Purpureocillium lavendulum]|uniref:Cytochrome P450 monooxygenase n=1 Tax=Purpureocillium lavendulum TaxID=1247861 RepID=A0AB34FU72_9HYPO|nr:cytochrome P450 monooxygenase [Purpureocillium lavendulum]